MPASGEDERMAEDAFLAALATALEREPCYVVAGTSVPDEFAGRCAGLCPVVRDPNLPDAALIVAGEPGEWTPLPSAAP